MSYWYILIFHTLGKNIALFSKDDIIIDINRDKMKNEIDYLNNLLPMKWYKRTYVNCTKTMKIYNPYKD